MIITTHNMLCNIFGRFFNMFQGWLELQLENDFPKTQMFEYSVKEMGKFSYTANFCCGY